MWIAGVVAAVVAGVFAYEYRLRKPDQFVLYEANGTIRFRSARFYPRHFSLALPGTTHLIELKVDGVAKGGIQIRSALAITVAPSRQSIGELIRVGGWRGDAVLKAAKELETVIQGAVKEHTETCSIEELSSAKLSEHLGGRITSSAGKLGLDLISLAVQSVDPLDPAIAEAMRQRESARILEQTELLNQNARVAAARAKLAADEQIAASEHELELKRYELRKAELEQETLLAQKRTEDELKRSRMRLAYEKEEMGLLKSNPELLLLSPQAARLAEASQTLKNARTIVSLAPADAEQGAALSGLFQRLLDLIAGNQEPRLKSRSETEGS